MTLFFAYLLPLLFPTAVYMLWRIWRERGTATSGAPASAEAPVEGNSAALPANEIVWRDAPWLWLALAGIALMAIVMLIGVFVHDAAPPMRYVPPHIENGRVVPGEMHPEGTGVGLPAPQEPRGVR
jgi:heme A synthase